MCDGSVSRIATYTFMIAGSLSPVVAIAGGKLWPKHAMRVGFASLGLFMIAGVAAAFMFLC